MVFNATFNNISGIPWRSVLLVEELQEHNDKYVLQKLLNSYQRMKGNYKAKNKPKLSFILGSVQKVWWRNT